MAALIYSIKPETSVYRCCAARTGKPSKRQVANAEILKWLILSDVLPKLGTGGF
jgi:hypothetical protein